MWVILMIGGVVAIATIFKETSKNTFCSSEPKSGIKSSIKKLPGHSKNS
jgi:hypothetical protein